MSQPELLHDIVWQGGCRMRGRVLCDTWLYVETDMRISRGKGFTWHDWGGHKDFEVIDVLATYGPYQKFRVAKLD